MGPYTDFIVVGTLNGQTCTTKSDDHSDFLWHLRGLLGQTVLPLSGEHDLPQYSGGIYTYIFIYIYVYICVSIYIYIYHT
jgi:hypothetical protein